MSQPAAKTHSETRKQTYGALQSITSYQTIWTSTFFIPHHIPIPEVSLTLDHGPTICYVYEILLICEMELIILIS